LKIYVAKDDVFLVGVCVLPTKPEVCNRSIARAVCSEALMLRSQYFAGLYIVRSKYDYTSSPQLVKGVG
jgi:hypothetical protein